MIKSRVSQILYCDDTEEQRYAMRRILEGSGFTVIEAATGKEALEKIHADVLAVVLDVKLPDISGYEVCRRIKANPATAAIPVLQVSASFADPVLRSRGLQGGADAYVAQPVHAAELLALVSALIRSHDSDRNLRFQAEVSRQLALSLDYDETVEAIRSVFVPRFADRCRVLLRPAMQTHTHSSSLSLGEPEFADGLPPPLCDELLRVAEEVSRSGQAHLIPADSALPSQTDAPTLEQGDFMVVPLGVGRKQMGTLVFELNGLDRRYQVANIPLAQDLADRAALALQNANLYQAQRAAQTALIQSEKLAAAGRLSAAIAHEINNPLESITNLMYLIDTSGEISPTVKQYVQEVLSELSRLTHIARQSLGFYRELTGPQEFDLNESVEDTLNIYLMRFQAKKIHVERKYAPEPLRLCGVKGEVRQVISNLLVNAYDALPSSGTLRIETCRVKGTPAPDSTSGTSADKVVLRVSDDGPGIAPPTLARIFEPFFTTKQGTGTGLGLWVSDTIVTKHGGTIEVTTSTEPLEHGTTFEMTLPITLPAKVSPEDKAVGRDVPEEQLPL
jgi:two-component system NtrC family sensor kinase